MTSTDRIEETQHDGPALSVSSRSKNLLDLWRYDKTRKLIVIWAPYCLFLGAVGIWLDPRPLTVVGAVVYGILQYSLVEYLMHRYLFHYEPESKILRFITADVARSHTRHHQDPGSYGGAINGSQIPVVGLTTVLALLAWAVPFFPTGFGFVAIAAGAANYVAQELVHFSAHHMPMRRGFLGMIQRHHMLHHYRDGTSNYGLFWTFWDYILGTNYKPRAKSAKAG